MRWIDAWAAEHPGRASCFIQCGTSTPPEHTPWREYLDHDELQLMLDRSAAVVSHAGPGTIIECRRRGVVPIVVPRRPEFGEHVDDHQVRFSHRLARSGHVLICEQENELRAYLDRLAQDRAAFRTPPDASGSADAAIERFAQLVDMLVRGRAHGGSLV